MSDTPRKKVNILEVCQANLEGAESKIQAIKKQIKEAELLADSIKTKQNKELNEANAELAKNTNLIRDVESEGLPSAKLHEKAATISARIKELQAQHANSKQLADALASLEHAVKELGTLEGQLRGFKLQVEMANTLKSSYEWSKGSAGAIDAIVFECLEDAIDDYVKNIPFVIGFSKELNIDRVGLWQVPRASSPHVARIFATAGKVYRINRIPEGLAWLKEFKDSAYSDMPTGEATALKAKGISLKLVADEMPAGTDSVVENEIPTRSGWMGKMDNESGNIPESLFAPEGPRNYVRSGLCFIRSEGRFYSLFNNKFAACRMVPGEVEYREYGHTYKRDGEVAEPYAIDASCLFGSFWEPVSKKLDAVLAELKELQSAQSPLAVRIADAVKAIGVLAATFESRNKRLTSAEITKEVGAYWDAFVNSPWEGHISGDVAMLKHLCERKLETPHVWSNPIKGFYGLRVRTRDHDWITAYMYCPPTKLSPAESVSHDDVSYIPDGYYKLCKNLVRIGPCFLKVIGREK
jgi:hypothetical protein